MPYFARGYDIFGLGARTNPEAWWSITDGRNISEEENGTIITPGGKATNCVEALLSAFL